LQGGLDRPIARVDAQASRLIRFVDDKGGELTRPPGGKPVNPFFENNKPIIVKLGPKSHAENVSGTENGFLPLMCPKSVPDTNGTRLSLTHWAIRCYGGKHRHID